MGFSRRRAIGTDMKVDGVAWLHRDLVCVAEYLDLRHGAEFPIEKPDKVPCPVGVLL
jgi:hypothetical protein